MENFFCAEHSRQSGVDIIGSASEHQIYVAIECPPPWASYDLESSGIPDNLRELADEIDEEYDRFQTRFLLIYNERLKQDNLTILIFRKQSGLSTGYVKQEFHLADIQDVAPLVKQYVMGEATDALPIDNPTKDILICTHGSRDRCCSRFGNPIYHQALKIVEERSLDRIRVWQASHIGGHRMAPTAVTFPDARYYGYLTPESLRSILTQTGLDWIAQQYRGCGRLPWAAQILERELIVTYGWQWFDYRIEGRVLEHNEDESINQVEIVADTPKGDRHRYTATILLDKSKTVYLKGSCNSETASLVEQYRVEALTDCCVPV
ncbi:sucrase ferredoxin [Gloeocapsopsis crepidinum LEGE 06123]|uniref:Sucrase ferredoxin n=1 Tax=Gloeocapsopsis crepidinum LEGE 06123 TaxID=588587 RepID=A0ABR9UXK4_9CHRO|nr:sucrase ferredoxin [Gloeocapsopsis crepidinum]MBE9193032.1 sucrase ferredoxin [Gloeocapsopsis crepidinum LEGE 06123]